MRNNQGTINLKMNLQMKKKYLVGIAILAIAAIAAFNVNLSPNERSLSMIVLANIEALAANESGGGKRITCYNELEGFQGAPMEDKTWCDDCKARPAAKWSRSSECLN